MAILGKAAACLLAATAAQAAPAAVIAPAFATAQLAIPSVSANMAGMDLAQPAMDARQAILEGLLTGAQQQVAANSQMVAAIPTLSALIDAHTAYAQLVSAPQAAPAAQVSAAAKDLMDSVIMHYATAVNGQQQIEQLMQTDASFAAAANVAAARRDDECDMVSNYYTAQYGKISQATKACLCDASGRIPYVYCRALLAADLNTDTIKNMKSTITERRMERIASGHPGGMNVPMGDPARNLAVNNTWQPASASAPAAAAPSLLSRRDTGFDPLAGEFSAGVCVGEVVELCVTAKATCPIFEAAKNAAGQFVVNELTSGSTTASTTLVDFLSKDLKTLAEGKLELDISICLGLPGLTEVLNDVGISLCLTLLQADLFYLQGPTGQLSTGLDLLIVNFSAWYKYKFANASPVCPQDQTFDMMGDICPKPTLWTNILNEFADEDFCNMEGGQGIYGATITLDLLFYTRQWNFGDMPEPRDSPVCIDGKAASPGVLGFLDNQVCPAATHAYLMANPDVLVAAKAQCGMAGADDSTAIADPCVSNQAREQWLQQGRIDFERGNTNRQWPGRLCIDQTLFCWEAQAQFWRDNMDVVDSDMYGPDMVDPTIPGGFSSYGYSRLWHNVTTPRDGAWQYFLANNASNLNLLWRGDLCDPAGVYLNTVLCSSGSYSCNPVVDLAHAQAYVNRYPDLTATFSANDRRVFMFNSDGSVNIEGVHADWFKYGQAEGRVWVL